MDIQIVSLERKCYVLNPKAMKFVNQLRNTSKEAPKKRATRPVIRPKNRAASKDTKTTHHDEQFLFI